MGGNPTYQNITATVRPPRCAIFINGKSKYWEAAVEGAIAQASEVWGGRYFLIVPTDGITIADKFWELLEAYSPDHLTTYTLTFAEVERVDAKAYLAVKEAHRKAWIKEGRPAEEFEESYWDSASMSRFDELEVSEELQKELLYRLSPFHHESAIEQYLSRGSGFGYPFTKIAKIASSATKSIGQVVVPKAESDPTMSVLIHSQTGFGSEEYRKELDDEGFTTVPLPDDYESMNVFAEQLGEKLLSNSVSYSQNMPFSVSMLHLGQYYDVRRHRSHKEPVVLVLGDGVDDFCFYYSLSRMHEGVVWLPLAWLKDLTVALNQRRKMATSDSPKPPLSRTQNAAMRVTNLAYGLIKYGYESKRIQICSMSLSKRQLVAYKTQMARVVAESTRFTKAVDCVEIESISTSCTLRVFEQDNYANQQSMPFMDGKSVSSIATPKLKKFSDIRLPDHYWLTSLQIEGYQPPSLPTLGPEIVKLFRSSSTTESRVANDGIVYQCPNAMIFSNDLDAVLVRPKIEMPDVMDLFNSYFAGAGITARYSDKGRFFNDTIRRFGGLDALGEFIKAKATRSVLEKFMQTNKDAVNGVFYVKTDQRAYLDLDALTDSAGSPQEAADLVDDLLAKEVIYRGYILKCERCSLSSWYNLDVLSSVFTCNRCSLQQQFTQKHWKNGMVEPRWCYKLAETVYQFYLTNSHLTAQVLYKLKTQSTYAFHSAPEIDLIDFSGPGQNREMDVACILDGQIIFGECKTETLKLKDIVKFEQLVEMPIKNPARIVFATTQKVSEDFKKRMAHVPNAELMVRSDLYDD